MNTRLKTLLISFCCVLVSFSTFARQSPQPVSEDEHIERITVYGEKSIRELNKEIKKMTKSFFKDYNKLNQNNQYAVICKKQSQANTSIKTQYCEPRYVKSHRGQVIATRVFGNDPSALSGIDLTDGGVTDALAISRLVNLNGMSRVPPSQNKKFNAHVAELMKKHPHLVEKFQKILALQEEYAYKKANR